MRAAPPLKGKEFFPSVGENATLSFPLYRLPGLFLQQDAFLLRVPHAFFARFSSLFI